MIDQILSHLREHPEGVASAELAEKFLKFKNAGHAFALKAIRGLLEKDKRCTCDNEGRWFCISKPEQSASEPLSETLWTAVHLLANRRTVYHVSIWSAKSSATPEPLLNEWLNDPATLSAVDREAFGIDGEVQFDASRIDEVLAKTVSIVNSGRTVFLSGQEHALLNLQVSPIGATLADNYLTMGHLLRAANESAPRPLTLASLHAALTGREPPLSNPDNFGLHAAVCLTELLERLKAQGI